MNNATPSSRLTDLALLAARVPLGVYFAIAGYNKIAGPGVSGFVSANIDAAKRFMPEVLAKAYLGALPIVEMIVGLALVVGLFARVQAVLITLMLVSFTMAMGGLKLNMVGVAGEGPGEPFNKNVVFLGLSIGLALLGGGRIAADRLLRAPARRRESVTAA
jgi:uncharacterized membrane protein YphA (DoxX/SURF4 family)